MLILLFALQAQTPVSVPHAVAWVPQRVYDSQHKAFSDFESLAAQAARSDVVFFGEQHDDPGTHAMELALLEAVSRRRTDVVLAMEMFERDVQHILDDYLAGRIDETTFAHTSRPWPAYMTDYRPLVEFAKAHGWRVIAGNVPRKIASAVSAKGLDAITQLPDSSRPWAAAEFQCPKDDYFDRFAVSMKEHPMGPGPAPTADEMAKMTETFYQAQCVKDETMAESIVRARGASSKPPLVIHVNGSFHSDFGEGTAARTGRRLSNAKIMVISAVPVTSLDSIDAKPLRKQGDWLIFTLRP